MEKLRGSTSTLAKSLIAFFRNGPGRYATTIHKVRFLSISYIDDDTDGDWWRQTTDYAYEAFQLLIMNWNIMRVSELQLCLLCFGAISSVDDPGIWSLLKVRGLAYLTILGLRRCIVPEVRKWLKARTHRRKLFPWAALGVENPGPNNWTNRLKYQDDLPHWQQQYEWLDARYKYLHDRETVAARSAKQRLAYYKRRRRWPMLSKKRGSCL